MFRSTVSDFLLALKIEEIERIHVGSSRMLRPGSPAFGFSTLTTSAPSHASASVQDGPASNCDRSSTRTPLRQLKETCVRRHVVFRSRLVRSLPAFNSRGSGVRRQWRASQGCRHTVATGVAGEPTAPGSLSGGAVSRKRLRLLLRSQSASSDRRQISPRLTPVLNRQ